MMDIKLGRLESVDERDKLFPVSKVLHTMPNIPQKYWWAEGWWGNQGTTQHCVAYSWNHWLEDGPVIQDAVFGRQQPMYDTVKFYDACQLRDPWPGTSYDGTSIRAGAKILKSLDIITEYRWASNLDEVVNTILTLGPMVVGTRWYKGMFNTNNKGIVKVAGAQSGGHAYILDGVDRKNRMFRIKNSWGRKWGKKGFGFISFNDFDKLLNNGGEACIAFENKMYEVPSLDTLPQPSNP